jgi:ATP:cob(I)alamin adenosyltransferase
MGGVLYMCDLNSESVNSPRITTVYTRSGDNGSTSIGSIKLPKYHPCVHFIGSIDEALAFIGLAIENSSVDLIVRDLEYVYELLLKIASSLKSNWCPSEDLILDIERRINNKVKPNKIITNYVKNPRRGGVALTAITRTVIRRAERWFWRCFHDTSLGCKNIGVLLNRLSDLIFTIQYQALLLEASK